MIKVPETYEVDGESKTFDEWAKESGEFPYKLKNRWYSNETGKAKHTPRQIVGREMTNWRRDKLNRIKRSKPKAKMPPGAQAMLDGGYYKIGLHGFVYMLIDGDWVRSERDARGS
jgi:hypothetical protein